MLLELSELTKALALSKLGPNYAVSLEEEEEEEEEVYVHTNTFVF